MLLSDFLSLVNIGVTLVVGFYLTHWLSVRDSRHRALKDFYIDEVKSLSEEIGEIFKKLKSGGITGEQFVQWFNSIERRLDILDADIKIAFPVFCESLYDPVFEAHRIISNSDDFNNFFRTENHIYNAETTNLIVENEERIYKSIHSVVSNINECPKRGLFASGWRWLVKEWRFYIERNNNVRAYIWQWLKRLAYYVIIFILPMLMVYSFWRWTITQFAPEESELERRQVEAIELSVIKINDLNRKMDSLDEDLKNIHEKMKNNHGVINHYIHTKCIEPFDSGMVNR